MTDLTRPPALAAEALERIAAAQAEWVERHRRIALVCAAALCVLAVALIAVLLLGSQDTVTPQAVVMDGTLMGLVASALAGAIGNARYAERARRLAALPPAGVPCHVERLAADTKLRRNHLHVRLAGSEALILLRADVGEPMQALPERGEALLIGSPGRNRPVLVGVPGRAFIAARVAR